MANPQKSEKASSNDCFVIMPIADHDGYDKGHFTKVYEDIFKPACASAGFMAVRADEVKQTNLIHLDILQKLIDSPMAICDLSSRNPNVLFELGLRQAFDKPTVLVQEAGTPKIFDIAPLRYTEYRRELRYREVLEDQSMISGAIKATKEATDQGEGVNSIVRILSLSKPASLKEVSNSDSAGLLQLVRAEMSEMRSDFRRAMFMMERDRERSVFKERLPSSIRFEEIRFMIQEAETMLSKEAPKEIIMGLIGKAQKRLVSLLESDAPPEFRNEAKQMFMMCERLEHQLITQSN
jgi:hypothetical protein